MALFLIERNVANADSLDDATLEALSRRSADALADLGSGVRWLRSYLTADALHCFYFAPDAEVIREHARRVGIPADCVSRVRRVLDPRRQPVTAPPSEDHP